MHPVFEVILNEDSHTPWSCCQVPPTSSFLPLLLLTRCRGPARCLAAELCAGIYPSRESDGEENTGWSHLLHKGNVEVSFLPLVGFLRGWGEIKQDLNTFTAPFPPHFPVNLLLSWYLSEDIFSFALSSPLPTPISGF